jgi:hypothetical protein
MFITGAVRKHETQSCIALRYGSDSCFIEMMSFGSSTLVRTVLRFTCTPIHLLCTVYCSYLPIIYIFG